MTIIRHRQTAVNHTIPQNANKRALKGAKVFDPFVLNPLPLYEREWAAGGAVNYAETFPVDPDPMVAGFIVTCDVAFYGTSNEQPVITGGDWALTFNIASGGLQAKLTVGAQTIQITSKTFGRARWYSLTLVFTAGVTTGKVSLYDSSVLVGSLTYNTVAHVSRNMVACAQKPTCRP